MPRKGRVNSAWVKRTYLNQRFKGAFSGLSGFLRNRNKWKDRKVIEKELNKISAYSLHKDVRNKYPRRKIMVNFINEIWASDLRDISKFSRQNRGYKFIVMVVDGFSKKAYAQPIKDKTPKSMIKAFNLIFKEANAYPVFLYSDRGLEYTSKEFTTFLKSKQIKLYHIYSSVKSAFAERLIRTIFEKIYRYMTANNTYSFVDKLQDFITTYNNSYHRTLGTSPNSVTPDKAYEIWERMFAKLIAEKQKPRRPNKYHVGDVVRLSKAKLLFEKGKIKPVNSSFITSFSL